MKVTNGKDVARLLVDEYLNCHPTGHKKFMESMAKEQQEIKTRPALDIQDGGTSTFRMLRW